MDRAGRDAARGRLCRRARRGESGAGMSGADAIAPVPPVRDRDEATARLGMFILLGPLAMMYAALLFSYAVLRFRLPVWPPQGAPKLPVLLAGCNAALLALSGGALPRALASAPPRPHPPLAGAPGAPRAPRAGLRARGPRAPPPS